MRTYPALCLGVPQVLLPKPGLDLTRWAVIACDQYTSEPDYWTKVGEFVGESPSTLNLIFPEVYLNEPEPEKRIARIQSHMRKYLESGIFAEHEGFVYVERTVGRKIRKGLVACLDLEHYDFRKGSTSLIRATEGTILERIPPRVRIREGASLEIPHIMVLIDDPGNTVIGPLSRGKDKLAWLYDFELMMESGHLAGFKVGDAKLENGIVESLEALSRQKNFSQKYGLKQDSPILLFAMGDGNHSLATAKAIWDKTKEAATRDQIQRSPLRYALVELVNLHDDALVFEPIHRVLFGLDPAGNLMKEMEAFFPGKGRVRALSGMKELREAVNAQEPGVHRIGVIQGSGFSLLEVSRPEFNLPVGTLQAFLDHFLKLKGAREIDYVHGTEPVVQLGQGKGNTGFYVPAMRKQDLFKTVIVDGVLPRKTFSMGEAWEKRFYMEARKLF